MREKLIQTFAVIAFSLISTVPVQAQSNESKDSLMAKNTVYAELLGSGLGGSLNFERRFADRIGLRVGAIYGTLLGSKLLVMPMTTSVLLGPSEASIHPELGAGLTVGVGENGTRAAGAAILGFRYQPSSGGLFLRLAITPVFPLQSKKIKKGDYYLWPGFALGYTL